MRLPKSHFILFRFHDGSTILMRYGRRSLAAKVDFTAIIMRLTILLEQKCWGAKAKRTSTNGSLPVIRPKEACIICGMQDRVEIWTGLEAEKMAELSRTVSGWLH